MPTDAYTCWKYVIPKLAALGRDAEVRSAAAQRMITEGSIDPRGQGFVRRPPKRVDFVRDIQKLLVEGKGG